MYTRTVRNGLVTTSYLGCEYLKSGDAGAIVASYKRALLRACAPVEEWVARLFWYCADGADVMQGANTGVFGRLRSLQTELLGFSVVVPFHANCHRADLAFRDAMAAGNYGFLDIVADGMQAIALHWNHALARLGVLRTMCDALRTTLLKSGVLCQRRWGALAARAVRFFIRTYPTMVCARFALRRFSGAQSCWPRPPRQFGTTTRPRIKSMVLRQTKYRKVCSPTAPPPHKNQ